MLRFIAMQNLIRSYRVIKMLVRADIILEWNIREWIRISRRGESFLLPRVYAFTIEREFNQRLFNARMNNSPSFSFLFFRTKKHGAIHSEQTFPLTDASWISSRARISRIFHVMQDNTGSYCYVPRTAISTSISIKRPAMILLFMASH